MDLDLALNASRRLSPLVLPELTRLVAAKKRVLDRWPDIVPDAPERDHEAIIFQMLALLDSNRWEDVKMSFVLRALKVAFSPNFRSQENVAPIIDFAFAELEATTQFTFLNAMVAIYLSSYEPNADHSLNLGAQISAKRGLLSGKWCAIEATYPTLFDARRAHDDIAVSMVQMEEPWQGLKANGFPNPHATGLMDYVHAAYVDKIRPNLNMESWLDVLFKWLNPEPGKRKTSGSIEVIEAVLGHWVSKTATEQTRQAVTEHLINHYNDPRTNRSLWVGVSEDYMNVIFSWLTREDLRFFTSVVDATQKDPQWQPRKKFWLKLFDEGLIEQAWVAFCPSAERYARTHLIRSGFSDNVRRFGKQSKGGSRSDTSILIMKIGRKIVVDGCHNYRTHIFNVDDPVAPKLFRNSYDCDADVMDLSPWAKAHSHIPSWSQWVRDSIHTKTPMSSKKPWKISRARDHEPERYLKHENQFLRVSNDTTTSPNTPNSHNASISEHKTHQLDQRARNETLDKKTSGNKIIEAAESQLGVTQARKDVEGNSEINTFTQSNIEISGGLDSSYPKTENKDVTSNEITSYSSAQAKIEAKYLIRRLTIVGNYSNSVISALENISQGKEINFSDETQLIQALEANKKYRDEFSNLRTFLQPIFKRAISRDERSLWAKKVRTIERYATDLGFLSPKVRSALNALEEGTVLSPKDKNALEHMAQRLRRNGIELLELIHME